MNSQAASLWEPHTRLLTTRLTGDVHLQDVARWKAGLQQALAQMEDNSNFKLLVDLMGYESQEMAAHKAMRVVIPHLLAAHGLRSALFDLFPEVESTLTHTRGIVCRAVANVHHDANKMAEYERMLGRAEQRFFTTAQDARTWLLSLDWATGAIGRQGDRFAS